TTTSRTTPAAAAVRPGGSGCGRRRRRNSRAWCRRPRASRSTRCNARAARGDAAPRPALRCAHRRDAAPRPALRCAHRRDAAAGPRAPRAATWFDRRVDPADLACALWSAAVARLDPAAIAEDAVRAADPPGPVVVVAAGKAAAGMARGAAAALGSRLAGGIVAAPEADAVPAPLRLRVGSHPVANAASERAGRALLDCVAAADPGSHVVALISGGASALAAVPAPGVSLADKVAAVSAVMAAGEPIAAINCVRKHLSAIKGGRLAAASRAPVWSFIASDVADDDLSVVGGGPTVADPTSNRDALAILDRVGAPVSPAVRRWLECGPDTPKTLPADHVVRLVCSAGAAVDAAVAAGDRVEVLGRGWTGDVADVARRLAAAARAAARDAVARGRHVLRVAQGEPTVALPPQPGRGGRAQQTALLVARAIAGVDRVAVVCAGTDGIDGNTTAAGAVVDGATWAAAGPDPAAALARCDAYGALDAADALIVTGRTGVNCADLFVVAAVP
ncbi:MAG: DUF4147 domain-containing protein, partial [Deltaproteobacteria bacterium]